ncbi:MAG: glycosyltransferase family 2 protein [Burkholderiales bacterium]|jgi:glycosyltransferase involved in cell wall biosynthesis|nr:glycosyltransferase family 2 protein [Burkholderiales bacterium]
MQPSEHRIAVIVPCYKVTRHVLEVLAGIDRRVWRIYAVDDACPEKSGALIEAQCRDPRVKVLYHEHNKGVGGAVISGYRAAIADGATVLVKIDGDGQMSPALLPDFAMPILAGTADYTKGNRFYDLAKIGQMPRGRIFGNAMLSLLTKLSTGYWDLFDPTNGYTAIHAEVARHLPLERISERYFFESDMLFRLGTIRAVVVDVPMDACYGDENSNLKVKEVFWEFLWKLKRNFFKRIFYNYFLRDVSLASLELLFGLALAVFGGVYGICHWAHSATLGSATPPGTIAIAVFSLLVGLQLLLAFLGYDIANVPRRPLQQFFTASAEWRSDKSGDKTDEENV